MTNHLGVVKHTYRDFMVFMAIGGGFYFAGVDNQPESRWAAMQAPTEAGIHAQIDSWYGDHPNGGVTGFPGNLTF